MQKEEKNLIKLSLHISILIATFIFGFLVIGKGFRFDFFKKEKPKEVEVVEPEVTSEYLEEQLLIDLKDKVITVDEYFKNLLFAEYDKEYLSNRYYSLKRSEIPLDTDFIASAYVNKITDIILNYYLNRVLLTGITFDVSQENPEEKKGDVVAFADTVFEVGGEFAFHYSVFGSLGVHLLVAVETCPNTLLLRQFVMAFVG